MDHLANYSANWTRNVNGGNLPFWRRRRRRRRRTSCGRFGRFLFIVYCSFSIEFSQNFLVVRSFVCLFVCLFVFFRSLSSYKHFELKKIELKTEIWRNESWKWNEMSGDDEMRTWQPELRWRSEMKIRDASSRRRCSKPRPLSQATPPPFISISFNSIFYLIF